MRNREQIVSDGSIKDLLILEVLLDIRELLNKETIGTPEAPLYISDKPPREKKKKKV